MPRFDLRILICTLLVLTYIIFRFNHLLTKEGIYSAIGIGRAFVTRNNVSEVISSKAKYVTSEIGYDGQFFYYIALDPVKAHYYIDDPIYRYTRIFYPMLTRFLSFGNYNLIPYILLILNISAVISSVFVLGLWFKKFNYSPFYSLIYGFFPGVFFSLTRDLSETVAYFFAILAVFLFSFKLKRFFLLSSSFFSIAILTKEVTALFPLAFSLSFFLKKEKRKGLIFILISFLPIVLYKLFLITWLGTSNSDLLSAFPVLIPFSGLNQTMLNFQRERQIYSIIIPGLIMGSFAVYSISKKKFSKEVILVLLSVLLFVVFLNKKSFFEYAASSRINIGVVIPILFSIPYFTSINKIFKLLFILTAILWLQPWRFLFFIPLG